MFKPPLSRLMDQAITNQDLPAFDLTVLVGSLDWQSPADLCSALVQAVSGNLVVVEDRGHDLGRDTVVHVLDQWLSDSSGS